MDQRLDSERRQRADRKARLAGSLAGKRQSWIDTLRANRTLVLAISARAMDYIWHILQKQAVIMAYVDVFYTWAVFALLLIPVVLLLVGRVGHAAPQSATMH
ncbi:MAG TPA: hypothetical protein VMF32_21820 [Xanthobacteraceae bacterium]|nr:hypothetical protein [Xanthobacteraceae bacterium]